MSNSGDGCVIREPYPATKERLVQRTRQLSKKSAEMATTGSNVREYYYSDGFKDYNPTAESYVPSNAQTKSLPNTEKKLVGAEQVPVPPKTTLNPESKPFVPSDVLAIPSHHGYSGLNVEAPTFLPSFLMRQPEVTPIEDVSETLGKMKISNKEDLMKFLDGVLQTLGTDPSMHDLLIVRLSKELKEENVEEVVKELVNHGLKSVDTCYDAARIVESLCTKLGSSFRGSMLKRLQRKVQESECFKPDEIVVLSWFVAEISMRLLVNGQRIDVLKLALLDLLKKMLESSTDTTIQAGCCILKLTGAMLEGGISESHKQQRDAGMDDVFTKLNGFMRDDNITKQTRDLVLRVIQLRGVKWEQPVSSQPKGAVSKPATSVDEDGTVYFHNTKTPQPVFQPVKGYKDDWMEYIDETGNPYVEHSDTSFDEQFDIESEFEQFKAEELFYLMGGEVEAEVEEPQFQ